MASALLFPPSTTRKISAAFLLTLKGRRDLIPIPIASLLDVMDSIIIPSHSYVPHHHISTKRSSRIYSVTGFDSHYSFPPSVFVFILIRPFSPIHLFHFYTGLRTKIYPPPVVLTYYIYTFYYYYYYVVDRELELYHTGMSAITSCSRSLLSRCRPFS